MPIIEVVDDDENEQAQPVQELSDLLQSLRPKLKVPKEFQNEDWAVQDEAASLISWRKASVIHMKTLWDTIIVCDEFELKEHFRYSDSQSPILFKTAIIAMLELISKTTQPDSPEKFDRLFALLGDSVIGGAWSFGYREPLLIQSTYEALPLILDALGIASVRFLKGMVPQLLHTLVPSPEMTPSVTLQEASLRALHHVIVHGASRMAYWSGEIVSGIAKCWVLLEEKRKGMSIHDAHP
ncbi:hypothetical protein FRC17_000478 [Serendipita sp. 399]|nr:hypothetical protein FRC17_000478 [Serendipita sp. 399]